MAYAMRHVIAQLVINQKIAPIVGAYCIRPELRRFCKVKWQFAERFTWWRTGRMQYAPTIIEKP